MCTCGHRDDAEHAIVLTTNKPFAEWTQVFPHAACTVTLVDHLVHRAEVIEVTAESYRLKEAKSSTRSAPNDAALAALNPEHPTGKALITLGAFHRMEEAFG